MLAELLLEPLRAYWARKRSERWQYEAQAAYAAAQAAYFANASCAAQALRARLREGTAVEEDPDAADWRLLGQSGKEAEDSELQTLRDKARSLADHNPHARNILQLHRDYVVGRGMRHEIVSGQWSVVSGQLQLTTDDGQRTVNRVASLWHRFLAANDWTTGQRKDWEFCIRTWRDGECFLRLFRQPTWPPRVHFIDPEHIGPDPRTGLPAGGIETAPGNVEMPLAYFVSCPSSVASRPWQRTTDHGQLTAERIDASLVLHTKIGVDANVKRGLSLFLPVIDALKRFQGWLDVELIQRKVASSIVLVRKHEQGHPTGLTSFADDLASGVVAQASAPRDPRRVKIQPGSIIDAQGFDLQFLSPDTHFDDASLLGRMILLSIAAGTGLPEFMLSADASNANYASTLVAEGPAVRHFAAWQSFFVGAWQKLFAMVMQEAIRLGLLTAEELEQVTLQITPPPLAVRNRHVEALADAVYFDRGALSARELARRDHADPELMQRERKEEKG
jgi:capsid protein